MARGRLQAFLVLKKIYSQNAFSSIALGQVLDKEKLEGKDRALTTELVYGVLRWQKHLDYILSRLSQRPFSKVDRDVKIILRLGLYQLRFLSKIPQRAAVYETVSLAKKNGLGYTAGFINGILRNYLRNKSEFDWMLPQKAGKLLSDRKEEAKEILNKKDLARKLGIVFSHPEWLVEDWINNLGFTDTVSLLQANNSRPPLIARVNTIKTSLTELNSKYDGLLSPHPLISEGVYIKKFTSEIKSLLDKGLLYIQGTASQMVAKLLAPEPGQWGVDLCAAPGGKTTHLAQLMKNKGRLLAVDLHPHRVRLIEDNCERLGINIVKTKVADALEIKREELIDEGLIPEKGVDFVLIDAPCSGFGLLAEKPEIRYRKNREEILALKEIQLRLLQKGFSLVKPGGIIFYSTCTIVSPENEGVVSSFCQKFPVSLVDLKRQAEKKLKNFKMSEGLNDEKWLKLFPHRFDSEGFFMAKMTRLSD